MITTKEQFDKWVEDYGLRFEPNYSTETEADCRAAFEAGKTLSIPEGHKLVPIEPTEEMQEIGIAHIPTADCQPYDAGMVYIAMVEAYK